MANTLIIPWSKTSAVTFEYREGTVTISAPRFNKYVGWIVDIEGLGDVIYGVPLYSGIDILVNFLAIPTNSFIFNKENYSLDITNLDSMVIYSRP
jgi:hypothetical protein